MERIYNYLLWEKYQNFHWTANNFDVKSNLPSKAQMLENYIPDLHSDAEKHLNVQILFRIPNSMAEIGDYLKNDKQRPPLGHLNIKFVLCLLEPSTALKYL